MNILVCISAVPDTNSDIKFNENNFDFNNINLILNPYDEYHLSKILNLKKDTNNIKVTTLNVGEKQNDIVIKKTLTMGADNAIRIKNSASNSLEVGELIAKYINENNFDLIVFGKESIDFNGCCLYGIVSGLTNINLVSNVINIDLNNNIILTSKINNKEIISTVNSPVIIFTEKEIIEKDNIIIPNIRGIINANKKQIIEKKYETTSLFSYESYENLNFKKNCFFASDTDELINILKKDTIL